MIVFFSLNHPPKNYFFFLPTKYHTTAPITISTNIITSTGIKLVFSTFSSVVVSAALSPVDVPSFVVASAGVCPDCLSTPIANVLNPGTFASNLCIPSASSTLLGLYLSHFPSFSLNNTISFEFTLFCCNHSLVTLNLITASINALSARFVFLISKYLYTLPGILIPLGASLNPLISSFTLGARTLDKTVTVSTPKLAAVLAGTCIVNG